MRIINRGRGTGKTTMLVSTAYVTGKPIITSTMSNKNNLMDTAKTMGISNSIEVYTINEWLELLVDNIELMLGEVLSKYLNANVVAGTMTIPMDTKENDTKEANKKHGHWFAVDKGVYCSVCLNYNQKLESKYCPNCGSIMDEKENS